MGAEGLGVFAGALDGFEHGLAAGLAVGGRGGAQGPPGAVDAGEFEVGEAGGEFAEGGEVVEFGRDGDASVVGADAFARPWRVSSGVMEKVPVSSFSTGSP